MLSPRVISLLPHSMACALASHEIEAKMATKMSLFMQTQAIVSAAKMQIPKQVAQCGAGRGMRSTDGPGNEVNSVACPPSWTWTYRKPLRRSPLGGALTGTFEDTR